MTASPTIHVIGAGLAGLATALHCAHAGLPVILYEGSQHAGGRCRSYFDRELNCRIDNGNHLVFSGNLVMQDYLHLIGAQDTLIGPDEALFPFFDVTNRAHWMVRMNKGPLPWWITRPDRRVPQTKTSDYLKAFWQLLRSDSRALVMSSFSGQEQLYKGFWHPLTVAALNTEPEYASVELLKNIFVQSIAAGGAACMPRVPQVGLSETFIDPCLRKLQDLGVAIHFGKRVKALLVDDMNAVRVLEFTTEQREIPATDFVVLATPPWVAQELLPSMTFPTDFRSIVNAHFRIDVPRNQAGIVGLVGGLAEWVFVKPGVVSVTISAADDCVDVPAQDLAIYVWKDVATLYGLDPSTLPPWRIVKEKRATFAATPEQQQRRPSAKTPWKNLMLAGDYTQTWLPSTIEGALRSGLRAAQTVTRWMQ